MTTSTDEVKMKHVTSEENVEAPTTSKAKPAILTYTFSIEIFRFIASLSLLLTSRIGKIISHNYVFTPNGPIVEKDTIIVKMFGFNHACGNIDFNPAKEFAAIACFMIQVPFAYFVALSYFRIKLAYLNKEVSKGLYIYSVAIKPFCLIATNLIHMWFVNSPDRDYGFVAHYIPYMTFKIAVMLTAIEQVMYYSALNKLGVPKWLANGYVYFLIALTITYIACILSIILGSPILDSAHNKEDRTIMLWMAKIYDFCSALLPIIFSGLQIFNGDNNTVTFGHQGKDGNLAFERRQTVDEEAKYVQVPTAVCA